MPLVARERPSGDHCATHHLCDEGCTTGGGSSNVFVQGWGVVRQGDKNDAHPAPDYDLKSAFSCKNHTCTMDVTEENSARRVYANNLLIAGKGDEYLGHDLFGETKEDIDDVKQNLNYGLVYVDG